MKTYTLYMLALTGFSLSLGAHAAPTAAQLECRQTTNCQDEMNRCNRKGECVARRGGVNQPCKRNGTCRGELVCNDQAICAEPAPEFVEGYSAISGGHVTTCAIQNNDDLATCWGGQGPSNYFTTQTPPLDQFSELSTSSNYGCGVIKDGSKIKCWGESNAVTNPLESYGAYLEQHTWRGIDTFVGVACAIRSDNDSLFCWGELTSDLMRAARPSGAFQSVEIGALRGCGLRVEGDVACWGLDVSGPGGSADPSQTLLFQSISVGGLFHACGVTVDGETTCWGQDLQGTEQPDATFASVATTGKSVCALNDEGVAQCWGANTDGQLNAPSEQLSIINAGVRHFCALRTVDDSVVCWGANDFGQSSPPQ